MEDQKVTNLDLLVKDYIRIIKLPKQSTTPIAVILVGPPFSGKTVLTEYLAKRLPLAVLSDLHIGSFLAPSPTFFKRGTSQIFQLATRVIEELMKKKISCVYDASIKKYADRVYIKERIVESGGSMYLIKHDLPEEEAFKRMQDINTQISQGNRKGFIMDRDFLRYEYNTIEQPTSIENPIIYNAMRLEEREMIESQLATLLKHA